MLTTQPVPTRNKRGTVRWTILAILFLSLLVNYVDRNVLSFTMIDPQFKRNMLQLTGEQELTKAQDDSFKQQMGYVDGVFKAAYAIGFLLSGWLIDRFGVRRGLSVCMGVWSLAGLLTSFVGSIRGLGMARAGLALGEAGNFPSANKALSEWFPQQERSLAFGILNASGNIGIILTAWLIPWLTSVYGWQSCFLLTGLLGFLVLIAWLLIYRSPGQHPRLSVAERTYIQQGKVSENQTLRVSWGKLLGYRQTWAFAVGKFLTDPIFWIYLTWLPDFFNSSESLDQKLDLKNLGVPFLIIYLTTDVGSIFFGWLSSFLIKRGWSVNQARKGTMFLCALCVVPLIGAAQTHSLPVAIGLIALAASAHQGWSANLFTSVTDLFPASVVGSVTGIGGTFGAIGGVLLASVAGIIRVQYGYFPLFVVAAVAYLVALAIIHLLVPKMQPYHSEI